MAHSDDDVSVDPRVRDLAALYEAFNSRDIETVIAAMASDVEWPNGWEGGSMEGRESVRRYWARQWAEVRVSLTPVKYRELSDGRMEVSVRQVARDPGGAFLGRENVRHVYEFEQGLVRRMHTER